MCTQFLLLALLTGGTRAPASGAAFSAVTRVMTPAPVCAVEVSPIGYASHEGKAFAIGQLMKLERDPEFFLDIGAGAGSWMEAVKPWFLESKWLALEAWKPYVERFCLWERYKMVIEGDARSLGFPTVDVVIMGDVLEHMTKEEAILVWKKAREASWQATILSIPVVKYPQGHVHDNPYQEHVKDDWTHEEVMETFEGIVSSTVGSTVGTYVAVT